ncbi:hypothetical protein [Clostridium tertium]|uniref:Lipocalin-like domain-containing protein n=1 Tax=Clostridium tertium TaxID=1559 RepID=A0A6N3FXD3_9CLOT
MKKLIKSASIILLTLCVIGFISIYTEEKSLNNKLVGAWVIESSGYNAEKYSEEDIKNMVSNGGIFQGLKLMSNSMVYVDGTIVTFKENNNLNIGLLGGNYSINDKEIEIDLGDGMIDSFEINIDDDKMSLVGDYIINLVKHNE